MIRWYKYIVLVTLWLAVRSSSAAGTEQARPQQDSDIPVPALPPGKRPNFLFILTDDQGWDDIGLHNPMVNTPNLDTFIQGGTMFDNAYVTPQCAQTRAGLLTGRAAARTGVMMVHGGWDFINTGETTAGQFMGAAGYRTAQFGKWHNSDVQGYEAWNVGFQDSYHNAQTDPPDLYRYNGEYMQASPLGNSDVGREKAVNDHVLKYLHNRTQSDQPFFIYYAPWSIHIFIERDANGKRIYTRLSPPEYKAKYFNNPKYAGVVNTTLEAWAALDYLDFLLGRVFKMLKQTGLDKTTYVMIMGDNGPALIRPGETQRHQKQLRMPSRMRGEKSSLSEGGIRTFLAVQGPGVHAGATDSTLVDIIDILPTMADMAGISSDSVDHAPWDGISISNLMVPDSGTSRKKTRRSRGSMLATPQQIERVLFTLGASCWNPNAVPGLDENREVIRSQALLDYDRGGMMWTKQQDDVPVAPNAAKGWQWCIAARYKNLKWLGSSSTVYSFQTYAPHLEIPVAEVKRQPQLNQVTTDFINTARRWWNNTIMDPHSFLKPTFYLGLGDWTVSNLETMGAHDRTPGHITLMSNGAVGFQTPGDRMCLKVQVLTTGTYLITAMYTSTVEATFKLSFGSYAAIQAGTAPALLSTLPPMQTMQGMGLGRLNLAATPPGEKGEACFEMISTTNPGTPVFQNLANFRIIRGAAAPPSPSASPIPTASPSPSPSASVSPSPSPSSSPPFSPSPSSSPQAGLPPSPSPSPLLSPSPEPASPSPSPSASPGSSPSPADSPAPPNPSSLMQGLSNLRTTATADGKWPRAAATAEPAARSGAAARLPQTATASRAEVASNEALLNALRLLQPNSGSISKNSAPGGRADAAASAGAGDSTRAQDRAWQELRRRAMWPDGQVVFESMYSPYGMEDISECAACLVDV